MSLNKPLLIAAGLLVSFSSLASNVALSFNNDNIDLGYDLELKESLKLKGDYLQTIDNGFTVDTGVYAFQDVGSTSVELGAKGIMMSTDEGDGSAIAFGGLGGLRFTDQFTVEGELHFTPQILAFGDTENYLQWVVRANFEVMPTAHFFVEYNNTVIEYEKKSDETITSDVLFGMKWLF